MIDINTTALVEAINKAIAKSTDTAKADAHPTVAELWQQPFLNIPADLMAIHACGRSKAYELVKEDDFPATIAIGRGLMVETSAYVGWLKTRAKKKNCIASE